jgi:hypothetical protein
LPSRGQIVAADDLLDDLDQRLPGAQHRAIDARGREQPVSALVMDFA